MGALGTLLLIALLAAGRCSADDDCVGSDALDNMPLVDSRNELAINIRKLRVFAVNDFDLNKKWSCPSCHTDLPRMHKGKVGAPFWSSGVDCNSQYKDSFQQTIEQIDAITRVIEKYPNELQFVDSAVGIEEAFVDLKIAALIGVDGGHTIDSRLSALRAFHERGARYMALASTCTTPWSGSGSSTAGLTSFGESVVREMNRLGMMVDLSGASHRTTLDAIAESRAPVIFSSANAWALCENDFNVRDDVLHKIKRKDGIVMVSFRPDHLRNDGAKATMDDVVAHINHVRKEAGVHHVGIGSGFDGFEKTAVGLEDVSRYPDLFDRLANNRPGEPEWNREELVMLASLNFIRVFKKVKKVSDEMEDRRAVEDLIPKEDLPEEARQCRTYL